MYMPHPHSNKEWASHTSKYNTDQKEKQQTKKNRKSEANAADSPKKSAGGNLSLSKSTKSALTSQVMLYNQEANQLVRNVLNGKFNELEGNRFRDKIEMCLIPFILP